MKRLTDLYVDPIAEDRARSRGWMGAILLGLALGFYLGAALSSIAAPFDPPDEPPPGIPLRPAPVPTHLTLPPIADTELVVI